jgi:HAD superfamily hydrolase (TIGR01490 family)
VPVAPTAIAFFDVDNTLLRGASLFHLARGARRQKLVTNLQLLEAATRAARFTLRGERDSDLSRTQAHAGPVLRGRTVEQFHKLAEGVYDRYTAPVVWPETLALVREHQAEHHEVWLLTTTPDFLAEEIARRLGATGAMGTPLAVEDGTYTGELAGPVMHGPEKAAAATVIAGRAGVPLADCWAYSDSINDLPLLEACGNRVVINADKRLRSHAIREGWTQMDPSPAGLRQERRRLRRPG